jgi:hypothetical protein
MADGDLSMTVTVDASVLPVLVTEPRTGTAADDRDGYLPRGMAHRISRSGEGSTGQDRDGNLNNGTTGRVS